MCVQETVSKISHSLVNNHVFQEQIWTVSRRFQWPWSQKNSQEISRSLLPDN